MPDSKPAIFDRFARWIERQVGSPFSFAVAIAAVMIWAVTGPRFGWSDTWQLDINTGTTIVTFLMVFLIQSTQTRDTRAIHLKLHEPIRVNQPVGNGVPRPPSAAYRAADHDPGVTISDGAPRTPRHARRRPDTRPFFPVEREPVTVMAAVELESLTKYFGNAIALDSLSLTIAH